MADYALVIGIERYETLAARSLQGPGLDAMRFALWLRNRENLEPKNIILFLNKSDRWDGELEQKYQQIVRKVRGQRIDIREDCSRSAIWKAWREELPAVPERGTLWIYWSGHGVTFPENRDAVLCANNEGGDPAFVYLGEIRDSLRSDTFARFKEQRLIVDACAEYIEPNDLNIRGFRNPDSWKVTHSPEQIELSAVPMGRKARAEKGGGLFSRVLFDELESSGWPKNLPTFYEVIRQRISSEAPSGEHQPRFRLLSPYFEFGLATGRNSAECKEILEVMGRCKVPFDKYRQPYFETMTRLSTDSSIRAASNLTAMVDEVLCLQRSELYGGLSEAFVEFACRVLREFRSKVAPFRDWLQQRVPTGALSTVEDRLNKQSSNLILTILLQESTHDSSGFPCTVDAHLSDANFEAILDRWVEPGIPDIGALESVSREILGRAGECPAFKASHGLTVQIFANPPLLGMPWQLVPVDPSEEYVFGELFPFVLRSRARFERDYRYDLESWEAKSNALRDRGCIDIRIAPAPPWDRNARNVLAGVEGLLLIRETLPVNFDPDAAVCQLVRAALKKGLPLVSWYTRPLDSVESPASDEWESVYGEVRSLFDKCPSLSETHRHFRDARRSNPWARDVALLWDDAQTAQMLKSALGEEPS